MARGIVAGAAALLVAGGWFTWHQWQPDAYASTSSELLRGAGQPSATSASLTLDVDALVHGTGSTPRPPQCGEAWQPSPSAVGAVRAALHGGLEEDGSFSATVTLSNTASASKAFLGTASTIVVTRDGVVVMTAPQEFANLNGFVLKPGETTDTRDGIGFNGLSLCDVAPQFDAVWQDFDWNTATPAERDAKNAAIDALYEEHRSLPAGDYRVFAWSPVEFGEQAAVARMFLEDGYSDLSTLTWQVPSNPLMYDERIARYCVLPTQDLTTDDPALYEEMSCTEIPDEAWEGVLTREVPVSYLDPTEPGVAISEPIAFTVN